MAEWTITQGAFGGWTITARDSEGNPVEFLGSETLSGVVWPGGNREAALTLTPTWVDAFGGQTRVEISNDASAGLDNAVYQVQCTVTNEFGATAVYYRGTLKVLASPGSDAEPPSYCTDDDLRDYASWIDTLQTSTDQTGFARQRGKAREWLDEILANRWRSPGFPQLGDPGYAAAYWGGGRDPSPTKWIRDQLAANKLIVRGITKEIVAKRTLYLICRAQLGCANDHPYQDLARGFRFESSELLKTYRAELDLNDDGVADLWINCGASSLR